jgi:hypothetical protein
MRIRMTGFATTIASLLAAGAVAAGGLLAPGSDTSPATGRTAVLVDAPAGRDGRDLVDPRLRDLHAELRLPRTRTEALTNVRYFAAQGYRVVVAGPLATEAATRAGVAAERVPGVAAAVAAIGR